MKAVILAAGRGTRIQGLTGGLPKCLLPFGDKTILDFQLDSLFQVGVLEVAMVVGHAEREIVDHVARRHFERLPWITFISNPEFARTNNIYSLSLAKEWVGNDAFFCLNADVLFHPGILFPALKAEDDLSIIVDWEFREETTKVIIENGRVVKLSKSVSREDYSGTFANIARFSSRGARRLFAKIESMLREGRVDQFFNDALGQLSAEGTKVGFTETEGLPWAEIDDANDFHYAQTIVYPALKPMMADAEPIELEFQYPESLVSTSALV
jgi:L-glutamine-phosphate cytidylyltransferase